MDGIFSPLCFRNEIIWKRTSKHSNATKRFSDENDTILYYSKSDAPTFNRVFMPHSEEYVKSHYNMVDENGRRFTTRDMRNPGLRPNLIYDYKGYKPHPNGWTCSKKRMEQYDSEGRLYFPPSKEGRIRLKIYLDETPGTSVGNIWDDIPPINSQAQERLGYPTQKPEALLERIIKASSNEGEVVLDPFCGCGTAIAVAQKQNRKWIGIDVTHLAIGLIKQRLRDAHGDSVAGTYEVIGEPTSFEDAEVLAKDDPYQFQWWALSQVGARPMEKKKGADHGIDGRLYFHDEAKGGKTKQIILSVKAGHTNVAHVRDLRGVIEREKAEIGVLLSMEEPSKPMLKEAADAGFYQPPGLADKYPRLQILTVNDLLSGKVIQFPRLLEVTYKRAPKAKGAAPAQLTLGSAE
jgi:hypothetical protein